MPSIPTALVTGGSNGVGYDGARALLDDGYAVVLHARAAEHPVLDLLVNAAAVVGTDQRVITENGNELALRVNYLAPLLLTRCLIARRCTRLADQRFGAPSSPPAAPR